MSAENNERSAAVDVLRERLLRQRLGGTSRGDRPGITPVDRDAPLRLSHGQQQMWFLNRLEPGSAEYLVPFAFRMRGDLDVAALRRAWTELAARHEILRTGLGAVKTPTSTSSSPTATTRTRTGCGH